jgi:glutamate-1-semialdehyde aminotransferase
MAEDLQQYTKAQLIEKLEALQSQGCDGDCGKAQELQEQLEAERKSREEYEQMVDELEKKLEATSTSLAQRATIVEHEDESYEITAQKFKHEGQTYNAEDLKEDKKLFKQLLDKGVGFIQKL